MKFPLVKFANKVNARKLNVKFGLGKPIISIYMDEIFPILKSGSFLLGITFIMQSLLLFILSVSLTKQQQQKNARTIGVIDVLIFKLGD